MLKSDGKKMPSCFENIALKLLLDLNLVAIYFAIQFFTNFQPHKLSILKKIFFCVQLLLSAIYRLFLSITGDALIHWVKLGKVIMSCVDHTMIM